MELVVTPKSIAQWDGLDFRCAIGRAGIATTKREGDGATPAGLFPMRRVLFRADRLSLATVLPSGALRPDDGWCDDPADVDYNTKVALPHRARCERLWRDADVYDLICVLGHNDAPVVRGAGSAIFLHIALEHYSPTEGCIALARDDLLTVLTKALPGDAVRVIAR